MITGRPHPSEQGRGGGCYMIPEIYLRVDPTEKLEALAILVPLGLQRGKFQAPDKLMAMLRAASRG